MSGIPCAHACAAIYIHKQTPKDLLDDCYKMNKYMQGYVVECMALKVHRHGKLAIHVMQFCHLTFEGPLVDRR